ADVRGGSEAGVVGLLRGGPNRLSEPAPRAHFRQRGANSRTARRALLLQRKRGRTVMVSRASMGTRTFACAAIAACTILTGRGTAAGAKTAREVIDQTSQDVITVLKTPGLASADKIARLERIADQHFDFETMARLVLARHWNELSDSQK